MWFDDDLDCWMAFECLNIVCGDNVPCPACGMGVLNADGSLALCCDVCGAEFEIEEE